MYIYIFACVHACMHVCMYVNSKCFSDFVRAGALFGPTRRGGGLPRLLCGLRACPRAPFLGCPLVVLGGISDPLGDPWAAAEVRVGPSLCFDPTDV